MSAPIRTCLGCGQKQPKHQLYRVALAAPGETGGGVKVVVDKTQSAPGRGAYLCGAGCVRAAMKKKAFQRALKTNVELDVTNLEAALQSA